MLRKVRETIREVEPEVISPASQEPFVLQLLAAGQLPGVRSELASENGPDSVPLAEQGEVQRVSTDIPRGPGPDPAFGQAATAPREAAEPDDPAEGLHDDAERVEEADRTEARTAVEVVTRRSSPPSPRRTRRRPKPPTSAAKKTVEAGATGTSKSRSVGTGRDRCDIALWRGYRLANFYARVFDEHGEPIALAESPSFRPHGKAVPDKTDAAAAAYDALCRQLERAGWTRAGQRDTWYGDVYERDT